METQAILDTLRSVCPDHMFQAHTIPIDETVIEASAACLKQVVACLGSALSISHLSTITGQDTGTELELLYHFWSDGGLTLRVVLSYDHARIDSLTDTIPGADFYEREIAEMLDVRFEGHPRAGLTEADGFEHFLLPEDWRPGRPPLRKKQPPREKES